MAMGAFVIKVAVGSCSLQASQNDQLFALRVKVVHFTFTGAKLPMQIPGTANHCLPR
jgi:hypothetical protein